MPSLLIRLALVAWIGFSGCHSESPFEKAPEACNCPVIEPADRAVPRQIVFPQAPPPEQRSYRKDYQFTDDWFSRSIGLWKRHILPLAGREKLSYLEIGTYEGRSFFWMLDNVLTHPSSRATGIDVFFEPEVKKRFFKNLDLSGQKPKVEVLVGYSQDLLGQLKTDSFDVIYVDGSHAAQDVLSDTVLSWRLLKTGGLMIFDDYGMDPARSAENRPMSAIDAFITTHRNDLEVVHRGYQAILKKRPPPPCETKRLCSRIHEHVYNWEKQILTSLGTGEPVNLSAGEIQLLEKILRSRRFGAAADQFVAEDLAQLMKLEGFERITKLLGIKTDG